MYGVSEAFRFGEPDGNSVGKPDGVSQRGAPGLAEPFAGAVPVTRPVAGSLASAYALHRSASGVTQTHPYVG